MQNASIESFNGHFRDECLNHDGFISLPDAQQKIEAWGQDDNRVRAHSSLGNRTAQEFTGAGAALPPEPPRGEEQKQETALGLTL